MSGVEPAPARAPAEAVDAAAVDVPAAPADTTRAAGIPPDDEGRFPVDVEGFHGSLEELVARAQRGEIDLAGIPVATITSAYRARVAGAEPPDPREVADFVALAARLVSLKAARLLPEGSLDVDAATEAAEGEVDDPGARLAEYRLFRAAAEALLSDAAEQGMRSFLGLVSADVVPSERLSIPPERLAAAFRRVLERIPQPEPLTVDAVSFSVEEKARGLRTLLASGRRLGFDEIFAGVRSRLEAVAVFLALLELIRAGEVRVDQDGAFGEITVAGAGRRG